MKTLYIIILIALSFNLFAQGNVGIGTNNPDASSKLDISSTNTGLLVPRVALTSLTDNLTIASPAISLLIYNTATAGVAPNIITPGYYFWEGTKWVRLLNTGAIKANNGLSIDNDFVQLGGTLVKNTTIDQGGNTMSFTSTATNGFSVDGATLSVDAANDKVGIGTISPSEKLQINNGNVLVRGNGNFTSDAVYYMGDNNHFIKSTNGVGVTIGSYQVPTGIFLQQQTGSVGFGTNSPQQKLHVLGTGRFTTLGGSGNRLIYADNNGDLTLSSSTADPNSFIDGTGAANRVAYWADANTLTNSANFTYSTSGNLSVYNAENITGEVRLGAAWNRPGVYSSTDLNMFAGQSSNNLIFGNANNELARITGGGWLGIGTNNPLQTLDVNGRINVNSGVIQKGGTAITTTTDLGLYSRTAGNWMRYVTNNAAHVWFTADGTDGAGSGTEAMRIEPTGEIYGKFRHITYHSFDNGSYRANNNEIVWLPGYGDGSDDVWVSNLNGILNFRNEIAMPYNGKLIKIVCRVGIDSGSNPDMAVNPYISVNGTSAALDAGTKPSFSLDHNQSGVYIPTQNNSVNRGDRVAVGFAMNCGTCRLENTAYFVTLVWEYDIRD